MARFEPCLCGDPECPRCYPGVTDEALEELREVDNTPVPLIPKAEWDEAIKRLHEEQEDNDAV